MLVLTRKANEVICIGQSIELQVLDIRKGRVKIGLSCPRSMSVIRGELRSRKLAPAVVQAEKVPT